MVRYRKSGNLYCSAFFYGYLYGERRKIAMTIAIREETYVLVARRDELSIRPSIERSVESRINRLRDVKASANREIELPAEEVPHNRPRIYFFIRSNICDLLSHFILSVYKLAEVIAGEDPGAPIRPPQLDLVDEVIDGERLVHRFSSADRDPLRADLGILKDLLGQFERIVFDSGIEGVRGRVPTAGAFE